MGGGLYKPAVARHSPRPRTLAHWRLHPLSPHSLRLLSSYALCSQVETLAPLHSSRFSANNTGTQHNLLLGSRRGTGGERQRDVR
jgi:hypothetical protein